ncbi:hypothetical protein KIPB_012761 [Kipferlia bialata]|uniref:Uncharacterized protein n=1 Tax=Kipferlia bialata TaxID=797122 RepID=A0A9K3D9E8_9EUKA|nr:hypothetical protein KIPB_012761 [Kipferlia bialata]|eukprot:g12761.t1
MDSAVIAAVSAVLVVLLSTIILIAFETIPTNHAGLLYHSWDVSVDAKTYYEGWHFVGPWRYVCVYSQSLEYA